eukprot:m.725148 g.725148  ORF g.725148 m.725148 type:complete len:109 (+) comp23026_c0_seq8:524-850(+)
MVRYIALAEAGSREVRGLTEREPFDPRRGAGSVAAASGPATSTYVSAPTRGSKRANMSSADMSGLTTTPPIPYTTSPATIPPAKAPDLQQHPVATCPGRAIDCLMPQA